MVSDLLEDERFQLPTKQASEAVEAAKCMLEWYQDESSKTKLQDFCGRLAAHLERCLPLNASVDKDEMWRQYLQFRLVYSCSS